MIPERIKRLVQSEIERTKPKDWGKQTESTLMAILNKAIEAWENPSNDERDELLKFIGNEAIRRKKWRRQ